MHFMLKQNAKKKKNAKNAKNAKKKKEKKECILCLNREYQSGCTSAHLEINRFHDQTNHS